jgi:hypothetical protein
MVKFKLRDRVRITGNPDVRTVEEIRVVPGMETMYWVQLGSDFVTRVWAKESELELADILPRASFTIRKGYKVFLDDAEGEPMDEPDEQHLFGWLRTRGYSDTEAGQIIAEVNAKGLVKITLP